MIMHERAENRMALAVSHQQMHKKLHFVCVFELYKLCNVICICDYNHVHMHIRSG